MGFDCFNRSAKKICQRHLQDGQISPTLRFPQQLSLRMQQVVARIDVGLLVGLAANGPAKVVFKEE